jgi:hypothetical protein
LISSAHQSIILSPKRAFSVIALKTLGYEAAGERRLIDKTFAKFKIHGEHENTNL